MIFQKRAMYTTLDIYVFTTLLNASVVLAKKNIVTISLNYQGNSYWIKNTNTFENSHMSYVTCLVTCLLCLSFVFVLHYLLVFFNNIFIDVFQQYIITLYPLSMFITNIRNSTPMLVIIITRHLINKLDHIYLIYIQCVVLNLKQTPIWLCLAFVLTRQHRLGSGYGV